MADLQQDCNKLQKQLDEQQQLVRQKEKVRIECSFEIAIEHIFRRRWLFVIVGCCIRSGLSHVEWLNNIEKLV